VITNVKINDQKIYTEKEVCTKSLYKRIVMILTAVENKEGVNQKKQNDDEDDCDSAVVRDLVASQQSLNVFGN